MKITVIFMNLSQFLTQILKGGDKKVIAHYDKKLIITG